MHIMPVLFGPQGRQSVGKEAEVSGTSLQEVQEEVVVM